MVTQENVNIWAHNFLLCTQIFCNIELEKMKEYKNMQYLESLSSRGMLYLEKCSKNDVNCVAIQTIANAHPWRWSLICLGAIHNQDHVVEGSVGQSRGCKGAKPWRISSHVDVRDNEAYPRDCRVCVYCACACA